MIPSPFSIICVLMLTLYLYPFYYFVREKSMLFFVETGRIPVRESP